MSSQTTAWAAIAPEWATPPRFIHDGLIRNRRDQIVDAMGAAWRRDNESVRQGWKRAYRHGWRIKRVRITLCGEAE